MVYCFFWVLEGIITSRYDSEGQTELEGNDFSEVGMKWEVGPPHPPQLEKPMYSRDVFTYPHSFTNFFSIQFYF